MYWPVRELKSAHFVWSHERDCLHFFFLIPHSTETERELQLRGLQLFWLVSCSLLSLYTREMPTWTAKTASLTADDGPKLGPQISNGPRDGTWYFFFKAHVCLHWNKDKKKYYLKPTRLFIIVRIVSRDNVLFRYIVLYECFNTIYHMLISTIINKD